MKLKTVFALTNLAAMGYLTVLAEGESDFQTFVNYEKEIEKIGDFKTKFTNVWDELNKNKNKAKKQKQPVEPGMPEEGRRISGIESIRADARLPGNRGYDQVSSFEELKWIEGTYRVNLGKKDKGSVKFGTPDVIRNGNSLQLVVKDVSVSSTGDLIPPDAVKYDFKDAVNIAQKWWYSHKFEIMQLSMPSSGLWHDILKQASNTGAVPPMTQPFYAIYREFQNETAPKTFEITFVGATDGHAKNCPGVSAVEHALRVHCSPWVPPPEIQGKN